MDKKDEKREVLLNAAMEVLLKYGPRKATLEDIASKADMATTSLYYYFKNKKDIIVATAEREIQRIIEDIDLSQQQTENRSLEKRLAAIWQASFQHPIKCKFDLDDFLEIIQYTREMIPKMLKHQNDTVRRLLEEGLQSGQLQIDDLDLATTTVSFAMRGMGQALIEGEDRSVIERALTKLSRLLIRGMQQPIEQQ